MAERLSPSCCSSSARQTCATASSSSWAPRAIRASVPSCWSASAESSSRRCATPHSPWPPCVAAAERLLRSLRASGVLDGVRGRSAVDVAAAARAVVALGDVMAAHPEIAELEVNPLLVTPRGALALDARVALSSATVK